MSTRSVWMVPALLVFVLAGGAAAQEAVDQEQPTIDISVGGLALGGYYHQDLAQVFTAGLEGSLVAAELAIGCAGDGQVILELTTTQEGIPTALVLTSVSTPSTAFPTYYPTYWPPSLRRITFPSPVSVTPGTQYALVLRSSGECASFQGPAGDPYAGGDGFAIDDVNRGFGVDWYPLDDRLDLPFRTIVASVAPRVSVLHHQQWLCVDSRALGAHLAHGDVTWHSGCAP